MLTQTQQPTGARGPE